MKDDSTSRVRHIADNVTAESVRAGAVKGPQLLTKKLSRNRPGGFLSNTRRGSLKLTKLKAVTQKIFALDIDSRTSRSKNNCIPLCASHVNPAVP